MTRKHAVNAKNGSHFHHVTLKNSDGTPVRVRVTGVCKTWKRDTDRFQLPVKYGFKDCFYITEENCKNWRVGYGS